MIAILFYYMLDKLGKFIMNLSNIVDSDLIHDSTLATVKSSKNLAGVIRLRQ